MYNPFLEEISALMIQKKKGITIGIGNEAYTQAVALAAVAQAVENLGNTLKKFCDNVERPETR